MGEVKGFEYVSIATSSDDKDFLTVMIEMLARLVVPVSSRSDMEITLNFVKLQAAVNATTIRLSTTPYPRRLAPSGLPPSQSDDIMDMLLTETLVVPYARVPLARHEPSVLVPPEPVHALVVNPLRPIGRVARQPGRGEDAVSSRILDVDVQVTALHPHDDVHVDLHGPADAFLDGECVHLLSAPPPRQL